MPELSTFCEKKKKNPSPIRRIMKMASRENIINMGLDPSEVISFGGGWVGHYAPDALRNEYQRICNNRKNFHIVGEYSPTLGTDACREAIVDYEQNIFDIDIKKENVIIGHSATQLTVDVIKTIADPADDAILMDPTYPNYACQIEMTLSEGQIYRIPLLDSKNWEYMPSTGDIISRIKDVCDDNSPRFIIIPTPDNPSSKIIPEEVIEECIDLCRNNNMYLILDEAYKFQSFINLPDYFSWSPQEYPRLIIVNSNSKWCRSLGRRLGWLEAHSDVIEGLMHTQECSILCPDTLHQEALTNYIRANLGSGKLKEYLNESSEAYRQAAETTTNEIREKLGNSYVEPQGGLYILMKVEEDSEKFVNRVLKNTGVLFVPAKGFGDTTARGIRISYGPHVEKTDKIQEGFKRVANYICE